MVWGGSDCREEVLVWGGGDGPKGLLSPQTWTWSSNSSW